MRRCPYGKEADCDEDELTCQCCEVRAEWLYNQKANGTSSPPINDICEEAICEYSPDKSKCPTKRIKDKI